MIDGVILKKLIRHKDERGFFEELIRSTDEIFQEGFAQLSHSLMVPGVIKAWHIHKTQTDWWFVSAGTLQVALYDLRGDSITKGKLNEFVLGEKGENAILKIPPRVAHGCKVSGGKNADLFYLTSKSYNPDVEEGRLNYNDSRIGYDWLK